jgi:hypothetical protein
VARIERPFHGSPQPLSTDRLVKGAFGSKDGQQAQVAIKREVAARSIVGSLVFRGRTHYANET